MAIDEREFFDWNAWNKDSSAQTHFSELYGSKYLVNTAHTHDFYEIFVVLQGGIGHWVNGEKMILQKGQVLFIRPDDRHCFYAPSEEESIGDFINIEISCSLMQKMADYIDDAALFEKLQTAPMPPTMVLSKSQLEQLKLFFSNLRIHYSDELHMDLQMRGILPQIFIWFEALSLQQHLPEWLFSLCEEMKKPENFIKGIERMREISGKSHGHLCYCFQKYLNVSPTGFLNNARMNYCAYLLRYTRQDILDIMLSAGFESPSHFYRLFQKEYQMTPARYRKSSGVEVISESPQEKDE